MISYMKSYTSTEIALKLKCTINIKVIPQAINKHNVIIFQAWTDSLVNFPYLVRAPLMIEKSDKHKVYHLCEHAYRSLSLMIELNIYH